MLDKTFDPLAGERDLYRHWEESGGFRADPARSEPGYCIVLPPPNVTGSLHIGHALNHTLQDILCRYKRKRGFDVLWQPGTDHAGIATQMVVERQLAAEGLTRQELGREAFLERVWAWKAVSGGTIADQDRRLGSSLDWSRDRFTMDPGLSQAVRLVFVRLWQQGLIYRAKRLVNWDPRFQTAISDLEVVMKEIPGALHHLRYPLAEDPTRHIIVATTRPETMLGDTAVAVHPEDERYRDLIGRMVRLPLTGRLIPIVADDYADPETGSGAVKITPAHDFNDFAVGQRHDLPLLNILNPDATLNDQVPEPYRGLDRFKAREKVLEDLAALDLVEKIEPHLHAVPHGDRSDVVVEPFLTDQWFCRADVLARPAVAAVESGRTVFVPKQWENTFFEWMRNIQPWCISRQLWWGHRIPAWYGPDGHAFVAMTAEEAEADAAAHYGHPVDLQQDPDVLDTWFSSALWPFSTLGWPEQTPELKKYYPNDLLVTSFDIIFFWVARMMMMGLHFLEEVPFRRVYIHALVRDQHGQKMSKSKGNVVDPLALVETYGADALRFTLAALAAQGRDIRMDESRVEGYRNFATKLWNATRFAQMNGVAPVAGFDPASARLPLSRWVLGKLLSTERAVAEALEALRFNEAAAALYQFIWGQICDWYLELAKPVLQGENAAEKAETQAVCAHVLQMSYQLLNPFMPYLTERLGAALAGTEPGGLSAQPWPDLAESLRDPAADAEIDGLILMIETIRSLRTAVSVPAGAMIPVLLKDADQALLDLAARHAEPLRRLARVERVTALEGAVPKGVAQAVLGEALLILPLEGLVDLAAERQRLTKEQAKAQKDLEMFSRRLGNPDYVAKAPPEVVEEVREKLAEAESRIEKLALALQALG